MEVTIYRHRRGPGGGVGGPGGGFGGRGGGLVVLEVVGSTTATKPRTKAGPPKPPAGLPTPLPEAPPMSIIITTVLS